MAINNITDELNDLRQKQNALENGQGHEVDVMSIYLLEKYATYADSIQIGSLQDLVSKLSREKNATQYQQLVTDRIQDALSLKLHPIDDNLKKVHHP